MTSLNDFQSAMKLIEEKSYSQAIDILVEISPNTSEWSFYRRIIIDLLKKFYQKQRIEDEELYRFFKLFFNNKFKRECDEIAKLIPSYPPIEHLLSQRPLVRIRKTANKLITFLSGTALGAFITKIVESSPAAAATTAVCICTVTIVVVASNLPRPSRIAFMSNRDGNFEIYTMDESGSNIQRLTYDPSWDGQPNWSRDGNFIVFNSHRDNNSEIYIMRSDGTDVLNLTRNPSHDAFPQISPSGRQIIFNSNRDGDNEIFLMDINGANLRQLTFNTVDDYWATWANDGSQILFSSGVQERRDIYIMNLNNGDLRQLTHDPQDDIDPIMSPDGTQIAFISRRTGEYALYVMRFDGSNQRQIAAFAPSMRVLHPAWSPDSSRITVTATPSAAFTGWYSSGFGGGFEIYVVSVSGNTTTKSITVNRFDDSEPDWRP